MTGYVESGLPSDPGTGRLSTDTPDMDRAISRRRSSRAPSQDRPPGGLPAPDTRAAAPRNRRARPEPGADVWPTCHANNGV